jgi:cellulose/xylan binding protein with CBM9 domain
MRTILILSLQLLGLAAAAEPDVIISAHSATEFALTADPSAAHWQDVPVSIASTDAKGNPTPGHQTELRSRWTEKYLYFLFVCPYEELNLKSKPDTKRETRELWNWDVAEVFIGADFANINRYREYQVSPQGEFLDLDINSDDLSADRDMKWDSGFTVKARIDAERKIWYGEMKIPLASIDSRPAKPGNEYRANYYRLQGPRPEMKQITWRPTGASHHVPESFGRVILGR